MKSWWDMTKEEQDARMAIEPLTHSAVSETFRHPASYAELRLVKTVWLHADRAQKAERENERLVAAIKEAHAALMASPENEMHALNTLGAALAKSETPTGSDADGR